MSRLSLLTLQVSFIFLYQLLYFQHIFVNLSFSFMRKVFCYLRISVCWKLYSSISMLRCWLRFITSVLLRATYSQVFMSLIFFQSLDMDFWLYSFYFRSSLARVQAFSFQAYFSLYIAAKALFNLKISLLFAQGLLLLAVLSLAGLLLLILS